MTKRLLSEILWEAANVRLTADGDNTRERRSHTCEAVALVLGILGVTNWSGIQRHPALRFMKSLGCHTGAVNAFSSHECGTQRQGVRYMWLLLAMHVAEDENIWIEVSA